VRARHVALALLIATGLGCAAAPKGSNDTGATTAYQGGPASTVYKDVHIRFPTGHCAKSTLLMFADQNHQPQVATDAFILTDLPEGWDTEVSDCGEPAPTIAPWWESVIELRKGDDVRPQACYQRLQALVGLAPADLPHVHLKSGLRACIYTKAGDIAFLKILALPTTSRPTFEAAVTLWARQA